MSKRFASNAFDMGTYADHPQSRARLRKGEAINRPAENPHDVTPSPPQQMYNGCTPDLSPEVPPYLCTSAVEKRAHCDGVN